ncbi:MAG: SCO family protein [Alphaproteobacteria bacterium]|nr:SCO family protein [Alphaproteobacteria bacterium]
MPRTFDVPLSHLAFVVLLAFAAFAQDQVDAGDRVTLIDHELVDQTGQKQRFVSDVIGDKKAVIAGIYTGCTTICPITTLLFAELQDALGTRLEKEVRLISLSVDPAHDTPSMLADAAAEIDAKPGWFWLTGPPALQNEVLFGIGAYSSDITEHPPVFVVGDGATGEFVQLYGFPSVEEFLGLLVGSEGGPS